MRTAASIMSLLPAGIGIYASRIDRHSRASGNPVLTRGIWIPACAGMTVGCCGAIGRFLQNHWVDELCRYLCPAGEGQDEGCFTGIFPSPQPFPGVYTRRGEGENNAHYLPAGSVIGNGRNTVGA